MDTEPDLVATCPPDRQATSSRRETVVQETRSAFQDAKQHKFIAEVQRLSGRRVTNFISNSHVGPDLEIELFMLAPA